MVISSVTNLAQYWVGYWKWSPVQCVVPLITDLQVHLLSRFLVCFPKSCRGRFPQSLPQVFPALQLSHSSPPLNTGKKQRCGFPAWELNWVEINWGETWHASQKSRHTGFVYKVFRSTLNLIQNFSVTCFGSVTWCTRGQTQGRTASGVRDDKSCFSLGIRDEPQPIQGREQLFRVFCGDWLWFGEQRGMRQAEAGIFKQGPGCGPLSGNTAGSGVRRPEGNRGRGDLGGYTGAGGGNTAEKGNFKGNLHMRQDPWKKKKKKRWSAGVCTRPRWQDPPALQPAATARLRMRTPDRGGGGGRHYCWAHALILPGFCPASLPPHTPPTHPAPSRLCHGDTERPDPGFAPRDPRPGNRPATRGPLPVSPVGPAQPSTRPSGWLGRRRACAVRRREEKGGRAGPGRAGCCGFSPPLRQPVSRSRFPAGCFSAVGALARRGTRGLGAREGGRPEPASEGCVRGGFSGWSVSWWSFECWGTSGGCSAFVFSFVP